MTLAPDTIAAPSRTPASRAGHLLQRGLSSNVGVIAFSQVTTAALRFAANLVFTRLLAPEAFGVMLVIQSTAFIMTQMTETGVSPFVIRAEKGENPRYLDTLWTVSVLRGVLIAALVALGAPFIGGMIGKPEVVLPLQVASLMLVFQGFRSMAPFLATRRHRAAKNAWVELGTYAATLPVIVGLVAWTDSYWGLVFGTLVSTFAGTLATYVFYRDAVHRFALDRTVLAELWRFARFIFASSLVMMIALQFDRVFVAGAFTLGSAGLYAIAANLSGIAAQFGDAYYTRVYMPLVAARLRAEPVTPDLFYRPMRIMRPLIVFGCAAGATFGEAFVRLIFPPDYVQAGVFLSIIVVRPLTDALCKPTSLLFVSNDMAHIRFTGDCLRVVWLVGAGLAGWHLYGVWGLLWAVALTEVPATLYQYGMVAKIGAFRFRSELPVVAAALAGLAAGWLLTQGANLIG